MQSERGPLAAVVERAEPGSVEVHHRSRDEIDERPEHRSGEVDRAPRGKIDERPEGGTGEIDRGGPAQDRHVAERGSGEVGRRGARRRIDRERHPRLAAFQTESALAGSSGDSTPSGVTTCRTSAPTP